MVGLVFIDSLLLATPFDVFPGTAPPDNGLGGRLDVLTPPRGGCGKALMLIVFLMVFPATLTPGTCRNLLTVEPAPKPEVFGVGCGRPAVEGARNEDFGSCEEGPSELLSSDRVGMLPVLLRLLIVGSAGKALVGGPNDGLEGLGIEAAMAIKGRLKINFVGMKTKR